MDTMGQVGTLQEIMRNYGFGRWGSSLGQVGKPQETIETMDLAFFVVGITTGTSWETR